MPKKIGGSMPNFLQPHSDSVFLIAPNESPSGTLVTLVPPFPSVATITKTLLPSLAYLASTSLIAVSSSGCAPMKRIELFFSFQHFEQHKYWMKKSVA